MKLTWIVVADNTRARIFATDSSSSPLEELEDLSHTKARLHDREITSDLSGRVKSFGGGGHIYTPPTDPKQHEADNFAHSIARHLYQARNDNRFEQLILVAEPAFLGRLRNHLDEQLKKIVCLELDKEITTLSADDIRRHLPKFLPNLAG